VSKTKLPEVELTRALKKWEKAQKLLAIIRELLEV
jgi:hypothetical protein